MRYINIRSGEDVYIIIKKEALKTKTFKKKRKEKSFIKVLTLLSDHLLLGKKKAEFILF